MGVTVKSAVAKAGHDYIRRRYGEDAWNQLLDMLLVEDRVLIRNIGSTASFPVAVDGRVFEALVHAQFNGDRIVAASQLREGGACQADAMLDGIFSIFARYASPLQAFKRGGTVLASVYSNAVSTTTEIAAAQNGGAIHVTGLGESSFIAPWHCGWTERALGRMGGNHVHVTERSWEAGMIASPELVYDVRWG
ncbi:MAG: hypothetical protein CVT67_04170 [Actinobacteria bacterium HGW-Actinobacteria-7]|jgi:hypothetical protein|nr:MAG: hypothetical protein CVT67_04170 [Actinobacteria bacterium HGW-Actinobacteria-7]